MKKHVTSRRFPLMLLAGIAIGALGFFWSSLSAFAQDFEPEEAAGTEERIAPLEAANAGGIIPDQVRRPSKGEDPRYPRDMIIGDLGRGRASEAAYGFARSLLSALMGGGADSAILSGMSAPLRTEITGTFEAIQANKYRIGGGREEDDGSISFLFRVIGREQGAAGELYLRQEEESWRVDDIILEEPRDILEGGEAYPYDFTPYERFF